MDWAINYRQEIDMSSIFVVCQYYKYELCCCQMLVQNSTLIKSDFSAVIHGSIKQDFIDVLRIYLFVIYCSFNTLYMLLKRTWICTDKQKIIFPIDLIII